MTDETTPELSADAVTVLAYLDKLAANLHANKSKLVGSRVDLARLAAAARGVATTAVLALAQGRHESAGATLRYLETFEATPSLTDEMAALIADAGDEPLPSQWAAGRALFCRAAMITLAETDEATDASKTDVAGGTKEFESAEAAAFYREARQSVAAARFDRAGRRALDAERALAMGIDWMTRLGVLPPDLPELGRVFPQWTEHEDGSPCFVGDDPEEKA